MLTSEQRAMVEAEIIARADGWPIIPGTGGARKARVALPGRGKRGGARVIYFFHRGGELIAFFDIYAKSEQENLSDADKKNFKAAIAEIAAALRDDGVR